MHGKQILRLVKKLLLSWQFFNMSQKCGGHGISKRWFCYNTRNPFRDKSLTQISQTASLGASNFLIVHDQYSETTVAVCYYFCVFDNSSVSRGQSRPKVIRPLYLFPKPSATSWTPFYRKISQFNVWNTAKITQLIGEEIRYQAFSFCLDLEFKIIYRLSRHHFHAEQSPNWRPWR